MTGSDDRQEASGNESSAPWRVLVVEDDAGLNALVQKALRKSGFRVDGVLTGTEAIEHVMADPDQALLLDQQLPDMSGTELVKQLIGLELRVPFVAMTGHGDERTAVEMMKLGARDYLVKGFELTNILPEVFQRVFRELETEKRLALAENELRESEMRYRSLFNNINEAVALHRIIVDENNKPVDFVFLDVNATYEKLTNLKAEDIIGKRGLEVIPYLEQRWIDAYGKVAQTGEPVTIVDRSDYLNRYWEVKAYSPEKDHFAVAFTDVTARKQAEDALEKRIVALMRPLGDIQDLSFEDLFNIDDIQRLQDEFAAATGVGSIITKTDGTPLTRPSNFCRLCNDIIRKTEKGRLNCLKSDAELGKFNPEGPIIRTCMSGGLWDAGAAISISGKHIANWMIGQVRNEAQSEDNMREYAHTIGADEDVVVEAFREVPSMSREHFGKVAQALSTFANQLSTSAYQNMQQARFITDLKQKEEALTESENLLRTLIRTIPDLVWLKDAEGVYRLCNSRFESFFGAKEKDIVGKTDYDFVNKELADSFLEHDKIAMEKGMPSTNEEEIVFLDDGHHEYLETIKTPMFKSDGSLAGVLGVGRDITARLKSEGALRESESRLRSAQRVAHMGAWEYNIATNEIWASEESFTIFGMERKSEYLPLEKITNQIVNSDTVENVLRNLIQNKGEYDVTYEVIRKNDGKQVYIHSVAELVSDEAGEPLKVTGFIQDITEQKHLEEQLQIRERMDSIGTLAGGIAHDFNNLLAGIMGNMDLLRMDSDALSEEQREYLDDSYDLCQKSARLIKNFQSLSKGAVSEITSVDIHKVVSEVLTMLSRTTDRLIEKKLDIEPGIYHVMGQYDQLHQVFLNLGTNAVQAIDEKGVRPGDYVKVSAMDCCAADERKWDFPSGSYIHIVFEDTGAGMTDEVKRRAFEPLFSTKERGVQKGQGLGLAMVYNIITRNHSGYIEIETKKGIGTTFHIFLPKAEAVKSLLSPEPTRITGGTESVLIIEDEQPVSRMIDRILTSHGYKIHIASDGMSGLNLYKEIIDSIDLVILDLTLPKMSGKMVIDEILSLNPDAKVIISSGQSEKEIESITQAKGYISKPYQLSDLVTTVRNVLDA